MLCNSTETARRLRCELICSGVAVKFAQAWERQYFTCSLQHCLNFESHILTEVVLRFYVRYNHLAPTQYLGLVEWNPTWIRFLFGSGSWCGILPYDRCWMEACELLTHSPLPKLCAELTINVSEALVNILFEKRRFDLSHCHCQSYSNRIVWLRQCPDRAGGTFLRFALVGMQLLSKKYCRDGELLARLCPIWSALDLNLRPPTPKMNS